MVPTATYDVLCSSSAPYTGPQCQTDNETLTVFRGSTLSAAASSNITTALNSWYDVTTLNVVYEVSQVTTGTSQTDITYGINGSVPPPSQGYTYCAAAVSGYKCNRQVIHFINNTVINKGLACHETGHAVGMVHGQQNAPKLNDDDDRLQCMRTPTFDVGNGDWNRHQINNTYPN